MVRRPLSVVVAVLAVILAVTGGRRVLDDDQPTPAAETSAKPFVWDVTLDPDGRPYDALLASGSKVVRRPLTVLHAPSRRVRFMGGEYLAAPDDTASKLTLAERAGRRYPVHAIWEVRRRQQLTQIVGVVIVERDRPVVRWRIQDVGAYLTDGGVGGITTHEWATAAKPLENQVSRLYESEFVDNGRQHFTADVDGHEGVDTIGFANGWGDGIFPAIAGYDAAGRRLEIVLWTKVVPWRVAFPEGEPPAEVTKTENELADCLSGRHRFQGSPCRVTR
jgi:hypothetical protein